MKNIGIFYGSTTGTAEELAGQIAAKLNVDKSHIHDVASAGVADVDPYEVLILGTSTWGAGDLQDDWQDFASKLKSKDLSGKVVAFFGCGDSYSYDTTFCDGVGELYQDLQGTGCAFCGAYTPEGYNFSGSTAVVDGKLVGLVVDQINEEDKTEERMETWLSTLKNCL